MFYERLSSPEIVSIEGPSEAPMNDVWYTYILTNYRNTVFYVGYTNNLERRIHEHKKGIGSHFPKRYRLYKLVWYQEFSTSLQAARMEKR